jgi:small subunit ribosomal protein S3
MPRCGEPPLKYLRRAEAHVQLKPGIFGIRVKIMPPDAVFPDKIQIVEQAPQQEEVQEAPETEEKTEEPNEEKEESQ